jgi:hypothetical protein
VPPRENEEESTCANGGWTWSIPQKDVDTHGLKPRGRLSRVQRIHLNRDSLCGAIACLRHEINTGRRDFTPDVIVNAAFPEFGL